jgi:isoleucyl-tRNA synthetase
VLDDKGYKMSKSKGNIVDPLKMMEQYGADILRLWAMTSDFSEDIRIGKDSLKNTGDLYRRIRNTLRFLLGALDGFTKEEMIEDFLADPSELPELEQLVLHQLAEMDQKVREHIENYEFMKLTKLLHDFCNENLSAFYFDIRKDRLYCDDPNSFERRATRSVMAIIFNGLTAWLAPILAFTAEEAWSHRPEGVFEDADSVHLREFPTVPDTWANPELAEKWVFKLFKRSQALGQIEPLRASKDLGSSLEAHLEICLDKFEKAAHRDTDWAELCIVSSFSVVENDLDSDDAHWVGEVVKVKKASGEKCTRCWKVLPEVSENGDICNRCLDVVKQEKAA